MTEVVKLVAMTGGLEHLARCIVGCSVLVYDSGLGMEKRSQRKLPKVGGRWDI
jgi:hypothetical protein